jgi:DNA-binding SARP family transcriptional activator
VSVLRIHALGRLNVLCDETPLHFPTMKSQHLLCYLLLRAGRPVERDQIVESLWPARPSGKGRHSLATCLWRLNQILECPRSRPQPHLAAERSIVVFNTSAPYWFDVEAFEREAALGLSGSQPREVQVEALERALDLYHGDLLDGCYDDWCEVERERLQLLFLRVLRRLQRHYRLVEAYEQGIACGHRLLTLDSLQEDVHRELMRCYVASGQRPKALAHYELCREALRRELGIEPMPETRQLYQRIRLSLAPVVSSEGAADSASPLGSAVVQMRHALDILESAWQDLQRAVSEASGQGSASGNRLLGSGR